ncbi:hypothetical protein E0M25_15550 [Bacillus mycoides]|nr:hypothetical protein EXW31_05565 [Bacillus mycoides]QWH10869.1 hypothetical protein EXW38_05625 [Bacillus mycoides]TBX75975.1 hypothetical protein E0M25_15550 [Bacillus mycoides]
MLASRVAIPHAHQDKVFKYPLNKIFNFFTVIYVNSTRFFRFRNNAFFKLMAMLKFESLFFAISIHIFYFFTNNIQTRWICL